MQIKPFVYQVEQNLDIEENIKKNPINNQAISLGSSEILSPEPAELIAKLRPVGSSAPTWS